MANRPWEKDRSTPWSDEQREWFERTPKWKMAIVLKHLAARVDPDSYDDALTSHQWFAYAQDEQQVLGL